MAKWSENRKDNQHHKEEQDKMSGGEGNQTKSRLAMYDKIADNNDKALANELEGVTAESYEEGGSTTQSEEELSPQEKLEAENRRLYPGGKPIPRLTEEEDKALNDGLEENDTVESSVETKTTEATEATEENKTEPLKFKVKINGVEKEVTQDQLIQHYQKVEAADQYLAEAARLRNESQKQPSKKKDVVSEDDIALARAIQMGDEAQAVEAIKKLRSTSPSKDDVQNLVINTLRQEKAFETDVERFNKDYADLLSNPQAKALVADLDVLYSTEGVKPGYERFKRAAEAVKAVVGTVKAESTLQQKIERKEGVRVLKTASGRTPAPSVEKPEQVSDVIANMARARGQGYAKTA